MGMQQQGVPLQCDAVEEPVFVNAKQYHGILRRRQSRAKLEARNRAIKSKKVNLPVNLFGRFLTNIVLIFFVCFSHICMSLGICMQSDGQEDVAAGFSMPRR